MGSCWVFTIAAIATAFSKQVSPANAPAINTGAKVTKLYRENDYVVAHFDEGTAGCARLMVFDKTGTVYRSDEISDRATINENGVMIYRIAGTSQLVKAELR